MTRVLWGSLLPPLLLLLLQQFRFTNADPDHHHSHDGGLDEASAAMLRRVIREIGKVSLPPRSWNTTLLPDLEALLEDRHEGDEHDHSHCDARRMALTWLANEDAAASRMKANEYDRALLQRYALSTAYFATGGEGWTACSRNAESECESDDARWLSPSSHCAWDGINCKSGKLSWFDLSDHGLVSDSYLPLEITLLSPTLELLWTSDNPKLGGTLPAWIGEFQSLLSLGAYNTSMTGLMPDSLYTISKLNSLRLYKSQFEGSISTEIGNLKELKWLWIHDNHFEDILPNEIGQLSKLEGITLHGNDFAYAISQDEVKDESNNSTEDAGKQLVSNIIPSPVCDLLQKGLKHLWTDCEKDSLQPNLKKKFDKKQPDFVVKAGKRACSCCTKCFPTEKRKRQQVAIS